MDVSTNQVTAQKSSRRNTVAPRVSIIVPAINEATNLRVVLPQLPAVHEVILVDGGSVDDTVAVAHQVRPGIVVCTQRRRGKGNALATGFARATGDVLVTFDADGSADPAEIDRFVQALVDGADFAAGSRFASGGGSEDITRIRRMGNRALRGAFNAAFRVKHTDLCYGFNAFWADQVPLLELPDPEGPPPADGVLLWGDGFEIETVVACRFAAAGAVIAEVPSMEKPRIHGESNLSAVSDGMRVLRTLMVERRRAQHVWSTDSSAAITGALSTGSVTHASAPADQVFHGLTSATRTAPAPTAGALVAS